MAQYEWRGTERLIWRALSGVSSSDDSKSRLVEPRRFDNEEYPQFELDELQGGHVALINEGKMVLVSGEHAKVSPLAGAVIGSGTTAPPRGLNSLPPMGASKEPKEVKPDVVPNPAVGEVSPKDQVYYKILEDIQGIGHEMTKDVMEVYTTLESLKAALVQGTFKVSGVGKARMNLIKEALGLNQR